MVIRLKFRYLSVCVGFLYTVTCVLPSFLTLILVTQKRQLPTTFRLCSEIDVGVLADEVFSKFINLILVNFDQSVIYVSELHWWSMRSRFQSFLLKNLHVEVVFYGWFDQSCWGRVWNKLESSPEQNHRLWLGISFGFMTCLNYYRVW